jgi:hypothetical protein
MMNISDTCSCPRLGAANASSALLPTSGAQLFVHFEIPGVIFNISDKKPLFGYMNSQVKNRVCTGIGVWP